MELIKMTSLKSIKKSDEILNFDPDREGELLRI